MIGSALLMLVGQLATLPPPVRTMAPVISAEQRAAAQRLLVATGAPARRGPLIDNAFQQVTIFLRCKPGADDQRQRCAEREQAYADVRRQVDAARPDLIEAIADIQERAYAMHLSIGDMDAVAAFATTPSGRRFFEAAKLAGDEAFLASNILVLDQLNLIFSKTIAKLPQPASVTDPKR